MNEISINILSKASETIHFNLDYNCSSYDIVVGTTEYHIWKDYYIAILNWHLATQIASPDDVTHNYTKISNAAKSSKKHLSDDACIVIAKAIRHVYELVNH